jgi:hypothetical protein
MSGRSRGEGAARLGAKPGMALRGPEPRGTSPPPPSLPRSPITLRPCLGLRLPPGHPVSPGKCQGLNARAGRTRKGFFWSFAHSTGDLGSPGAPSLRAWPLGGGRGGVSCGRALVGKTAGSSKTCSVYMAIKSTLASKLITLNRPHSAGPGDGRRAGSRLYQRARWPLAVVGDLVVLRNPFSTTIVRGLRGLRDFKGKRGRIRGYLPGTRPAATAGPGTDPFQWSISQRPGGIRSKLAL